MPMPLAVHGAAQNSRLAESGKVNAMDTSERDSKTDDEPGRNARVLLATWPHRSVSTAEASHDAPVKGSWSAAVDEQSGLHVIEADRLHIVVAEQETALDDILAVLNRRAARPLSLRAVALPSTFPGLGDAVTALIARGCVVLEVEGQDPRDSAVQYIENYLVERLDALVQIHQITAQNQQAGASAA